MAYSVDLRQRVVHVDRGQSAAAVAEQFDVSLARSIAWSKWRRDTGSIAPREQIKLRGCALSSAQEARLVALITARLDATLAAPQHALPTHAA